MHPYPLEHGRGRGMDETDILGYILVGQAVFKLWIKIVKMLFGSITQEPLGLLKCQCHF